MIIAFVVIAVIFDVSENVDRLIKSGAPFSKIAIDYYLMFCLYLANMLSSFLVFLTIIMFTSKLAQNSEVIAIMSSGVSLRRLMRPYFLASAFLVAVALVVAHWLLPFANQRKYDFEEQYTHGDFRISDRNLHREIAPGKIAYFQSITAHRNVGYKFSLEEWEGLKLKKKLIAAKADFLPETQSWELTNGYIRSFLEDGTEHLEVFGQKDTLLDLRISDFGQRDEVIWNMNHNELQAYIEKEKFRGSSQVSRLEVEMYGRTSNAFSIFVLAFIGVSISARKLRGGTGVHILLAIVVGFLFLFASRISAVAATNVGIPALIAVWIPNITFTVVGIFIYLKAPK